ncbi:Asperfuranone polyketide synthase [Venturia nashicola]|uniref:Phytase A n=1 Tax=Venturia nashicola TaxID=86259 RepID=A0A4Z1P1R3_9PEZI|nr:Asperfuranone polyketide synthase [Venturia nashicola]
MFAFVIFFSLLAISRAFGFTNPSACDGLNGFSCKPEISHWLGQYSPYYSVPSVIKASVPETCTVTFAQSLSRHGARDPTASKTKAYSNLIESLKSKVGTFTGKYAFLNNYEYTLGADQLTTLGQQELVNQGIKFYERYNELAKHIDPFVRSAGQQRVVESAYNWTLGYQQAVQEAKKSGKNVSTLAIEVIPEGEEYNNTLSIDNCPAFSSDLGDAAQNKWISIFVPNITARINNDLPSAKLNDSTTIYLMDLCAFDTVASPTGNISDFCYLFTDTEWRDYDYYQSLGKYYGYGPGSKLGPTRGVGFVNELIARMTSSPVRDETTTNHTLDTDPSTFPIGKKYTLFADFSHDNDMMNIFSAFGLFNATKPLSNTTFTPPEKTNGFSASWAVPFSGRAYFEKLQCAGQKEEMVRVLLNDRVVPLETCGGNHQGLCTLSKFVDSLSFARAGGFWDECFDGDKE